MREEISSLLSCLDLEDFREKNAAVSDLAMLLENHSRSKNERLAESAERVLRKIK